jgi:hypothetical protein
MQGNNVAVSRRRQSDQTQIEGRVGKGWIIFGSANPTNMNSVPKASDKQIQQDRADNSMIGENSCALIDARNSSDALQARRLTSAPRTLTKPTKLPLRR